MAVFNPNYPSSVVVEESARRSLYQWNLGPNRRLVSFFVTDIRRLAGLRLHQYSSCTPANRNWATKEPGERHVWPTGKHRQTLIHSVESLSRNSNLNVKDRAVGLSPNKSDSIANGNQFQ